MKIALPWPPKELSPNSRGHWTKKAKAAKRYRVHAYLAAMVQRRADFIDTDGPVTLEIVFYPPDKRRRDLDNIIASMKPALDGIADALGVDDSRFKLVCSMGDDLLGYVEIVM